MTAELQNHDHESPDPHDRLVEIALAELVGNNTPPDLTSRIIAAELDVRSPQVQPAAAAEAGPSRRASWRAWAVAASVLVVVGGVVWNAELREASKSFKTPPAVTRAAALNAASSGPHLVYGIGPDLAKYNKQTKPESLALDVTSTQHGTEFARRSTLDLAQAPVAGPGGGVPAVQTETRELAANGTYPSGGTLALDAGILPAQNQPTATELTPTTPAIVTATTTLSAANPSAGPTTPAGQPIAYSHDAKPVADQVLALGGIRKSGANAYNGTTTNLTTESYDLGVASSPVAGGVPVDNLGRDRRPHDSPVAYPDAKNWEELSKSRKDHLTVSEKGYYKAREKSLHGINDPRGGEADLDEAQLLHKLSANGTTFGLRRAEDLGSSRDQYTPIVENAFIKAIGPEAVSTFSIDVDTASYANVRQFLLDMNQLPPPNAVRIEELVNYFKYDYKAPPAAPGSAGGSDDAAPFAANMEVAACPWNTEHRLARIAIKGREMDRAKRPKSNLVFLVDVSGSMDEPAKLPLVVYGLQQLTKELGENDRISIVVYAGSEGLALESTSGMDQKKILKALGRLQAGGSTAGGAGINLAYQIAEDNFVEGGTNRVILCTDGDFNVGVTNTDALQKMVAQKAKDTRVFLSVLGFGRGNLNDAMMEAISNHGNGNYHYVDNRNEARKVLVEEMTGTLVTIAKDVKIQIEFNPSQVAAYRLIGYEDRMLKTEDFNNDKKDAGEIGAGHTVTALYELVPAGKNVEIASAVDELKYQQPKAVLTTKVDSGEKTNVNDTEATPESLELLTLKMRYKAPESDTSKKLEWPITDGGKKFADASREFQFATAVAGFGMLLRDSQYKGNLTFAADLEIAQGSVGEDENGYRAEFLDMVRKAESLKGE